MLMTAIAMQRPRFVEPFSPNRAVENDAMRALLARAFHRKRYTP